jgi:mono/diheme cytochrome c family protein
MNSVRTIALAFVLAIGAAGLAFAGAAAEPPRATTKTPAAATADDVNEQWMMEGDKRYRVNCARCHQPPHKFSPRVMGMVVRHMRVRGMLTQEDMKYVLYYMTH